MERAARQISTAIHHVSRVAGDEPDEDDGQDSPADAMQDAPNEPERAADASEGPPPPPADQTATASDSAMDPPPPPAPMESDEEQDVPGTTI